MLVALGVGDYDFTPGDRGYNAGGFGHDHLAAVPGHPAFDAGADDRGLRPEQRYCLALHVGAHQRPVGVVVFQEGDQSRRNAHDLHRRHVHQVHRLGRFLDVGLTNPDFYPVGNKLVQVVQRRIGLGHPEGFFLVRRQVQDVILATRHKGT